MAYKLTARGCEAIGGDIGAIVTIAEVQDILETVMDSDDDIEVLPDGLILVTASGERSLIAQSFDR